MSAICAQTISVCKLVRQKLCRAVASRPGLGLFLLVLALGVPSVAGADDWPQWLGPKRDSIWREEGIVERFPDEVASVTLGKPTLEDVFIARTGHRFWDEDQR